MFPCSFYLILRGSIAVLVERRKDTHIPNSVSNPDVSSASAPNTELPSERKVHSRRRARNYLGTEAVILGRGRTFGEVALMQESGVRQASVVVNDAATDLLVINRSLYHRSVERVQRTEAREKMAFVDALGILSHWSTQNLVHLVGALNHVRYSAGDYIYRQGTVADRIYFVKSGQVKLTLSPDPVSPPPPPPPLPTALSRKVSNDGGGGDVARLGLWNRDVDVCVVGWRGAIGDVEAVYRLPAYTTSAKCESNVELFGLDFGSFEQLFRVKNPVTMEAIGVLVDCKLLHRRPNLRCSVACEPLLRRATQKVQAMRSRMERARKEKRVRKRLREAAKSAAVATATGSKSKPLPKILPPSGGDVENVDSGSFLTMIKIKPDGSKEVARADSMAVEKMPSLSRNRAGEGDDDSTGDDVFEELETQRRVTDGPSLLLDGKFGDWSSSFAASVDMANALLNTAREDTVRRLLDHLRAVHIRGRATTSGGVAEKKQRRSRSPLKRTSARVVEKARTPTPTPPVDSVLASRSLTTPVQRYIKARTEAGSQAVFRSKL